MAFGSSTVCVSFLGFSFLVSAYFGLGTFCFPEVESSENACVWTCGFPLCGYKQVDFSTLL
jgi:hypothetical protein